MDLDNLKKTWQETNIKPNINEESIEQMLNNKTKGSYVQLLKTEKSFLVLAVVLVVCGCLFYFVDPYIGILYIAMLLPTFLWQWYKLNFLKKMDTLKMGIVEISQHINRYRKLIYWEIFGSIPIALAFILLFSIHITKPADYSFDSLRPTLIFIGVVVFITMVIVVPIYKFVYIKNIKHIEKSISEVKEFEREDE